MAWETIDYGTGTPTQPTPAQISRLPLEQRLCSSPFTFAYLPTRWNFDREHGWLPDLVMIPHKPAVNGALAVREGQDENGKEIWRVEMGAVYQAFEMKKGATILRNYDPRLIPTPPHSYVTEHRTKFGGRHHDAPWVRYEALGKNIRKTDDPAARLDFQRRAIATYRLAMPVLTLVARIGMVDNRLTRYAAAEGAPMDLTERRLRAELDLRDAMIAAWTKQFGGGQTPELPAPPGEALDLLATAKATAPAETPTPKRTRKPKASKTPEPTS